MNRKSLKRLQRLLRIVRCTIQPAGSGPSYRSGGTNYYHIMTIPFDIERSFKNHEREQKKALRFICHEIGHWLVVPPQRRNRKDFGIPEHKYKETIKTRFKYDIEEVKVAFIENELLTFIFGDEHKISKADMKKYSEEFPKVIKWWNEIGKLKVETLCDIVS